MGRMGWQFPSARAVRVLDIVIVVYVIVWAALGIAIGRDIAQQVDLADQVARVGATLRATGEGFEALSAIPFVGDDIGTVAERVVTAGTEVEASGRASADAIREMSVLVAVAVGVLPLLVLVPLYLPMRLAWRRDVAAVREALRRDGPTPALQRVLALRAVGSLPYDRLRAVEPDPWAALLAGDDGGLATAELARLGLVTGAQTPGGANGPGERES
ncbi:MAG: hypothetical protein JW767_11020 [Thermoleophilia bacterium]|nr:hypothetical protein [Thermoleophilia bacterium]